MPTFVFRCKDASQRLELENEGQAFEKARQMAEEAQALVGIFRERPTGELVGIGSASPKRA